MSSPAQARRATVDDLPALRTLWQSAGLPVADLEKRVTDFQLVEQDGRLLGLLALQISALNGRLHGEFLRDGNPDEWRALLWARVQAVARNHGLVRLWTMERAPFWTQQGFAAADANTLKKLPPALGVADIEWLTLKLKDETAAPVSLDDEFKLFKDTARVESERIMQQAKVLKVVAVIVCVVVLILVVWWLLVMLKHGAF
ncbi:MAG: hypothetical protein HY301_01310 [Verrucomicrobia bacterium]|nr:hypothetical protein [Verrucomicrobiota bacterium]